MLLWRDTRETSTYWPVIQLTALGIQYNTVLNGVAKNWREVRRAMTPPLSMSFWSIFITPTMPLSDPQMQLNGSLEAL